MIAGLDHLKDSQGKMFWRKGPEDRKALEEIFEAAPPKTKLEQFFQLGTRKVFSIDLNYVDLEKVEFIRGTDQGKVKARIAQREFRENKHSRLFKFIGGLIPNTSKQRIGW